MAARPERVVAMAGLAVSRDGSEALVTYALGSCVAVCVHDPIHRWAGMLHFMLPTTYLTPNSDNPSMFGATGIPMLFRKMFDLGSDRRELQVHLIGGARLLDSGGFFDVGSKNIDFARRLLNRNEIAIHGEDVGGHQSRTVRLGVHDGHICVSTPLGERYL